MNDTEIQALEDRRLARMTTTERANHRRTVAEVKAAPHRSSAVRGLIMPWPEYDEANAFPLPVTHEYAVLADFRLSYGTSSIVHRAGATVKLTGESPGTIARLVRLGAIEAW